MDFDLLNAVSYLEKADGILAAPLNSRYVLLCRVNHPEAVAKLYRISCSQHEWLPMLLGYDCNALEPFMYQPPAVATKLMKLAWPGELIIRLAMGVELSHPAFDPKRLGVMQPQTTLIQDLLSLQPGGVLLAVDACRYDDAPAQTAAAVCNSFGDDVDFILDRDSALSASKLETIVSVELDGSIRVLRSGEVVLD